MESPESTPEPNDSVPDRASSATPPATPTPTCKSVSYVSTPEMPGNVGEDLLAELQAMEDQDRRRRISELKAMGGYCRQIESNKARNRALEAALGLKWAVKSLFGPTKEGGPDRDPSVPKKRQLTPPSPSSRVVRRSSRLSGTEDASMGVVSEGGQHNEEGEEVGKEVGDQEMAKDGEDDTDIEGEEGKEEEDPSPTWVKEQRAQLLDGITDGADELPAVDSEDWEHVVDLLFQLERLYRYENPKRGLSTALRPPAVAWWSSRGRPNRLPKSPQIESVEGFSKEVRTYWESISPEWRHNGVTGVMNRSTSGGWSKMRCPGQNGLLSILACLRWWYMHEDLPGGSDSWKEMVSDVIWTLESMIKQEEEEEDGEAPPPAKKTRI